MTRSPNQPVPTGLDEFRAALLDYKSISSWALGGSVAVPLADYVMHLGPPWPWAGGVPVITSVAQLLTLICVFHFWSRSSRKGVGRRMVGLIILLVVFFGAYLYLNSSFTFSSPVDSEKHVKGFKVRPDVAPLITSNYTTNDALKEAEYHPEEVWTSSSITATRLLLLFFWLSSFIFLSSTISVFVLYQRRQPSRTRNFIRASADSPPP
jgi:hypothetical protein